MLLSVSSNLKNAAMLKALGYDALDVDLCNVIYSGSLHDPMLDGEDWPRRVEAARKECEDLGILPRVCHLPFTYRYSEPRDENFDCCHAMACRALKQIGYTGDFNLEIDFNRVPQALLEDYLGYSARVARYLISVFDNA